MARRIFLLAALTGALLVGPTAGSPATTTYQVAASIEKRGIIRRPTSAFTLLAVREAHHEDAKIHYNSKAPGDR